MITRRTSVSGLEQFGRTLLGFGIVGTVVGMVAWSKEIVAGAVFLVGLGYFLRDYGRRGTEPLNPMSIYMLFAGVVFGLANFASYFFIGTSFDPLFVDWRVDAYLDQAQIVAAFGVLAPPLGYAAAKSLRAGGLRLPPVGFVVSDRAHIMFAGALLAVSLSARVVTLPGLGLLGSLVNGGTNIAIFTLSAYNVAGRSRRSTALTMIVPALVIAESLYQFAFSYLRSDGLTPIFAALLPFAIYRQMTGRMLVLVSCLGLAFLLVMQPFADLRANYGGSERLSGMVAMARPDAAGVREGLITTASRMSTFSQISQVCRIVNDEGYQRGETMKYVAFVFIPRVVWPGKPQIVPGQWFAEKLGRGTRLADGRFSNAINMTVPGELFLNFGWLGAIFGLMVVGGISCLLWDVIRGGLQRNPMAQPLAFFVFAQAMAPAGHFGSVLNPVLWYVLSLVLGIVFRALIPAGAPLRRPALVRNRLAALPSRLPPGPARHD